MTATDGLRRIEHWVDAGPLALGSDRTAPVFDPATGVAAGEVRLASAADVDTVVASAARAFPAWRDASLTRRTQVLFGMRQLLHERGKELADAEGEVTRGLEVVEFACGIPHLLKGGFSENVSTKVDVYSLRQPLG